MGQRKRGGALWAMLRMALALAVTAGCVHVPEGWKFPTATPTPANDPFIQNTRLGRGVNLGNALEAPYEGAWGLVLREEYFRLIREAGFHSVRIPIRWSAHAAEKEPYTIDPRFFERVDWAINQALSQGLLVVINIHHFGELMASPQGQRERFLALWKQIAEHYQNYPPELLFELLNEPSEQLTAAIWNELLRDALRVIRASNPNRNVIVGPVQWNNIHALPSLKLPPEDRHLIVTVHYYEPFQFTHQGAEWVAGARAWLGTTWQGTEAEKRAIEADFDLAAAWAKREGRPLYLGEFGAYSTADMDSRARWTGFVARQAEARGMSWAYWEFGAGFGVYDRSRGDWHKPLLEALIPPGDGE